MVLDPCIIQLDRKNQKAGTRVCEAKSPMMERWALQCYATGSIREPGALCAATRDIHQDGVERDRWTQRECKREIERYVRITAREYSKKKPCCI
jgi:hypothetical protein